MGALIAGGLSLVGGVNAAYDESKASARDKIQAADNTQLAMLAAGDSIARGNLDAGRARMQGGQLASAQNVAYSNSGVDPTVGTPAAMLAGTHTLTELDAKTAENNAAAEAWGFKRHGMQFQQQAQLDAARSSSRAASSILTGAGRFGEGVSSTVSSWMK